MYPQKGASQKLTRIGVYVCHCGLNIAGTIDVKKVIEDAEKQPNVIVAKDYVYTCSDPGQEMIRQDINKHKLDRIVIASCSPKMHEETFKKTIQQAGLNPYLLEIVNLREQCSWCHTDDVAKATEKAKTLVRMGISRAMHLEPLERSKVKVKKSVLIIGGGIAGIQAALDLADADFKVYLVEKTPSIGGKMAQLDKTFPTLDCSACILTPKMADAGHHPNIKLLTCAEVENVNGYVGNYEVTVLKKPRYIDEEKCTGCGECEKVCPVTMPNEFDMGLKQRKAVYRPFPQAIPNAYTIDKRGMAPCRAACPAGVNVQGYIALASQKKYREALELIRQAIPFPAVCGRVCFHPCENHCERGKVDEPIAINAIKRFLSDYEQKLPPEKPHPFHKKHNEKIAIIGSGPAGLTAAYELTRKGYLVTVFESLPEPGGMLRAGIPAYRLPKDVLDREIDYIKNLGVKIKTNTNFGKDVTMDELLKEGFKSIFIAIGVQKGRKLEIEGEELNGVFYAIDFLKESNFGKEIKIGEKIAVIGGGNVAVDAARVALRLGAKEVHVLYRRSREEMPAYTAEVEEAEKEGIKFHFLVAPKRILGENGHVVGLECVRMQLREPDKTGRRRPVPVEGSDYVMEFDTVISAIGQSLDATLLPDKIKLTKMGTIEVYSSTLQTSIPYVFAGGDAVTGEATVIDAIASGKRAAEMIDRYLRGEDLDIGREEEPKVVREVPKEGVKPRPRQQMPTLSVEKRKNWNEVELGFDEDMVLEEAKRCLACGICSECLECERVCELKVINHKQKEERIKLEVGSIILAVGCNLFDATLAPELGYGRFGDVITNMEFERISNAAGPTEGKIKSLITGKPPKSVAFIQCVGSRDARFNEHCCRVGCMVSLKQAILVKEKLGEEVDVYICFNDMRAFGKGFEEFYQRAREMGVEFIHGLPSEIRRASDGSLYFDVYDSGVNKLLQVSADLVVLATGLEKSPDFDRLQAVFHVPRSRDGFFLETHPKLKPLDTPMAGIFLAGTCQGPKDIPDTVAQASGAAMKVVDLLSKGEIEIEPLMGVVDIDLCSGCGVCETVCAFSAIQMKNEKIHDKEKRHAEILEAVCQGCGACAAACPVNAIRMKHFTDEQILAQVKAACS
ncbi:FAD-dependent oxidoreductase [Candidatus Bathyarchaeota archaeon A05DMB-4]|nr:FAD-dependent oxidoreductase [Candidatus Bathyarchaeota archaeon A05DMB-4]